MSRSLISRIANRADRDNRAARAARPKSALVGSALVLSAAGMVIGMNTGIAAAAPAAPTSEAGSPKAIAKKMIANDAQFRCFSNIVSHESGWNVNASNPSSGAYGLVQALPGNKMASAGADWRTNPATQIKWGLDYMKERYGSPCGAWSAWQSKGWY